MQKFIAIPELGIIVRKIAPGGMHFAAFGNQYSAREFSGWVARCYEDERQFYWASDYWDGRRWSNDVVFKESSTCNSSS